MPRNGGGVYSLPAGSIVTDGVDDILAAQHNDPLNDLALDMNIARPVVAGGTGATTASAALVNLGLTATAAEINVLDGITASTSELNKMDGVTLTTPQINSVLQLAGRNRIINGQGRINQRAYVSGTATVGANQYTLDRWRVVTSGQSLTFTGNDARRTMTAPAGGVEQVIEGVNIEGGTYVINWTGTATCTVNSTARAKGDTFTLSANTDAVVRFTSGTFSDVQVELGTHPTAFERLPISDELARCQRYYFADNAGTGATNLEASSGANRFLRRMTFPVTMRIPPATSFSTPTYLNCSALALGASATGWLERVTVTATGIYNATTYVAAFDAEI